MFSCNDSKSLAIRKWFLRLNVIFRLQSNVERIRRFHVGVKTHNFKFPLILDKNNIMKVMHIFKFMQEFTLLSMLNVYIAVCKQIYYNA